jgi:antitoxin (DNA-binding transcriptional repressor) of toxin-antitoxin stability system
MARTVSIRELRNSLCRRFGARSWGRLTLTVNRRPVADILPHAESRDPGVPAGELRRIVRDAPADAGLLDDLAEVRNASSTIESRDRPTPSIFVAEDGRRISDLPQEIAVSVVTAAELEPGVLRLLTQGLAPSSALHPLPSQATYALLPIGPEVASCFAGSQPPNDLAADDSAATTPGSPPQCGMTPPSSSRHRLLVPAVSDA